MSKSHTTLIKLIVGSLFTNCYILGSEEGEALVVDPGEEAEAIIAALRKASLAPRYILATHVHFDHVSAMKAVQERSGGETLMHREDLPLLENLPAQGAAFAMRTGPIPKIDRFLREGDSIPLGEAQLRVLHTPGHSPGGICLLGDGMVFVGDTLFAGSIGRTDLPGCSHRALMASIRDKLLGLEDRVLVLPGHGEETTIGEERRNNPFVGEGKYL